MYAYHCGRISKVVCQKVSSYLPKRKQFATFKAFLHEKKKQLLFPFLKHLTDFQKFWTSTRHEIALKCKDQDWAELNAKNA